MERGKRIELSALAWKAKVLPLYEPRNLFGYPPGTRTPTNGFGDRGAAITPVSNYGFFGECGTSNTNVILSIVPLFHAE